MKPAEIAPQLLRLEDAGARLGVGRNTVVRLVNAGHIAVVDISAGHVRPRLRISETELARFIAARAIRAPGTTAITINSRRRRSA